jgi:hypothetical protein
MILSLLGLGPLLGSLISELSGEARAPGEDIYNWVEDNVRGLRGGMLGPDGTIILYPDAAPAYEIVIEPKGALVVTLESRVDRSYIQQIGVAHNYDELAEHLWAAMTAAGGAQLLIDRPDDLYQGLFTSPGGI